MFQYEYSIKGRMDGNKIWDLYSDVSRWPEWDQDMQRVVLGGEFATGTRGEMFMKEMPPLPFMLDEVQMGRAFVTSSTFDGITIRFGHYISADGEGGEGGDVRDSGETGDGDGRSGGDGRECGHDGGSKSTIVDSKGSKRGEYSLRHTVTITGPNEAQIQGMGKGIVANMPDNMTRLSELARAE